MTICILISIICVGNSYMLPAEHLSFITLCLLFTHQSHIKIKFFIILLENIQNLLQFSHKTCNYPKN